MTEPIQEWTPGEDVLAWATRELLEHYQQNPTHGVGCWCTDMIATRIRQAATDLIPPGECLHEQPEPVRKAQNAMFYMLIRATNGR